MYNVKTQGNTNVDVPCSDILEIVFVHRPMKDKTIIIFLHFNLMTVSKYKQYLDN